MNDKKRLNSYEDLPLVLDVAGIQRMAISALGALLAMGLVGTGFGLASMFSM